MSTVQYWDGEPAEDLVRQDDELLPEPGGRPLRRSPWLAAAVLVAVALAVVGIVRLASSSSTPSAEKHGTRPTSPPIALPQPTPLRHATPIPSGVLQPIADVPLDRPPGGVYPCPEADDGESACALTHRLPAVVTDAVTAHLPHAHVLHGYEELLRDVGLGTGGLWYRQFGIRIRAATLAITVSPQPIREPHRIRTRSDYRSFRFTDGTMHVWTLVHLRRPRPIPRLRMIALTKDARLRTGG